MLYAPDRSLIGFGVTSNKPWQSQRGLREVGNSTDLKLQHATEKKSLRNFRTGIGNNNSKSQVTAVTGSFVLYDIGPAQLALMVRAVVKGVAAGPVDNEPHPSEGFAGEMIVFRNLVDVTQPVTILSPPATASVAPASGNAGTGTLGVVTVNGAAAGAYELEFSSATAFTVTGPDTTSLGSGTVGAQFSAGGLSFTVTAGGSAFVADDAFTITVAAGEEMEAGVDYVVTHYGIQLKEGSPIAGRGVIASYTRIKADVSEILRGATVEQTLHFAGMNDAQNGKAYDVTLHRVQFDDIAELALSGAEYASYNVTFEALQDYTRVDDPSDPLSQFYTIRQAA
ncbi:MULTISPECIES: hypothetical protein [unclassified Pseudomonas]|uniref:hypothetical protein n=1 Tax=unclassified Pseudomonas TaxID=196821 RepID=UPI00244CB978|nr:MULTISPECIES: hypothetical protein [unclassified Pseudomonas]MDG9928259.1 hypothetical protein [Pseudomonas sp. GD04042]MDH0481177.1 hypothetical protein [Pseudomonas sp. GD04015]MDH0604513.1 hypothetical protein [Pseudomonas sp. GD03869]